MSMRSIVTVIRDKIKHPSKDVSNPGAKPGLTKKEWLASQKRIYQHERTIRLDILGFICNMTYGYNDENQDNRYVMEPFLRGNCYYFAKILEDAFGGTVCWLTEFDHIVWRDGSGNLYDAGGIFATRTMRYTTTPLRNMDRDFIESYKHTDPDELIKMFSNIH